jgi:radical SAM-linked protein
MERTQRLRVTFAKGEEVKFISHLDLMRVWERALRRAGIPMLYSQGYNPRPKISLAAPLAVGISGDREIMDVLLERPLAPQDFATSVKRQLPSGITLGEVEEVYVTLPALQTMMRSAEYLATIDTSELAPGIEARVASLLGSEHRRRQRRGKEYDLRPLVEALWLEATNENPCMLGMRLRADERGTGRPDEVLAELGLADQVKQVTRTRLHFAPGAEA